MMIDVKRVAWLAVGLFLLLLSAAAPVHAQELKPLNDTLDWLVSITQGRAARGTGILVFVFTVLGFSVGAVRPMQLGLVILGLAGVFGAPVAVDTLISVVR